jgi:hypothetical protein
MLIGINEIHLSVKCRFLLLYITYSVKWFGSTGNIFREIASSREVKHPRTIIAYTFIDFVYAM